MQMACGSSRLHRPTTGTAQDTPPTAKTTGATALAPWTAARRGAHGCRPEQISVRSDSDEKLTLVGAVCLHHVCVSDREVAARSSIWRWYRDAGVQVGLKWAGRGCDSGVCGESRSGISIASRFGEIDNVLRLFGLRFARSRVFARARCEQSGRLAAIA
jgi:hypothetical protein